MSHNTVRSQVQYTNDLYSYKSHKKRYDLYLNNVNMKFISLGKNNSSILQVTDSYQCVQFLHKTYISSSLTVYESYTIYGKH